MEYGQSLTMKMLKPEPLKASQRWPVSSDQMKSFLNLKFCICVALFFWDKNKALQHFLGITITSTARWCF
jgi:hypothetical protein